MDKAIDVNPQPTKAQNDQLVVGRERILTQFAQSGNSFYPTSKTMESLPSGAYGIGVDMAGKSYFERLNIKSDELLPLNNKTISNLREEIKKFWENKEKFDNMGFTHKRGFIFHGKPGTGKSCFIKLAMEDMTKDDSIVFVAKSAHALTEVLKQFKEVESERRVLVVLEDMDEIINYGGEHSLLELMDGPNSIGGVFYIGTTNYIERIPERMRRKSRFDRVVEIGVPSEEDRYAYFKAKLGTNESDDKILRYVRETDGMVYSDMKDLIAAIYCLDIPEETAFAEMKGGSLETYSRYKTESEFSANLRESLEQREVVEEVANDLNESVVEKEQEEIVELSSAAKLRKQLEDLDEIPTSVIGANSSPDPEMVKAQLELRLKFLKIDDVAVDNVDVDTEGNVIVDFITLDHDLVTVVFSYDEDEGANAIIYDGSIDDDDAYALVIELDQMAPSLVQTNFGMYINFAELSWLSKNCMLTILDAGDYDVSKEEPKHTYPLDAFGNLIQVSAVESVVDHELQLFSKSEDETAYKLVGVSEAFKTVVRGGKRERLPIIRRKRKKRLTPKQRVGIRKAARTRKSSASKLKRRKSLMLRKRMKIKSTPRRAGYRVGG